MLKNASPFFMAKASRGTIRPRRADMNESLVTLQVSVSLGERVPDDDVDLAARDLRNVLLEAGIEEVGFVPVERPLNSKGSTGTLIGDLALAVLPALLPKVIDLLKEWKSGSEARAIKVRGAIDGTPIEISIDGKGADAEAIGRILAGLQPGKQKLKANRS
jgi:hypothetical protein